MKVIEYEERVLISQSDYEKVIEDMKLSNKPLTRFSIENIYLDNEEKLIRKNKWMLRVRTINNARKELTLKIKNPDNSAIEINETLDHHPEIDKCLNNDFNSFKEITRLTTERIEVTFDDYLLVIDKNSYSSIVDYDIEIESDNQEKSKKIIRFYCEKYGLTYDPDYKTKSFRAFQALEKLN